jgi:phosphoribosylformimino-5-aminoimidazole carboxamide ribotide isomerase
VLSEFVVYPAIDLRGGECVRLIQGDPDRQEVVAADPVATACRWVAEGAAALHVVDLDGAFGGRPVQLPLLERIARAVPAPVRFGGGLRSEADVAAALEAGASSVVIGTAALQEGFFRGLIARWGPKRIIAGVDARGDEVAIAGWRQGSGVQVQEAVRRLVACGATHMVFTQVRRDGMLAGPDLDGVRRVAAAGLAVVASGGVTTEADVTALAALAGSGVCGAILGRALYAGRITLPAAIRAARSAVGGTSRPAPTSS